MRSEKYQIKRNIKNWVWWSREGKEEEERKVLAHPKRVTFIARKIIRRMTANINKSD